MPITPVNDLADVKVIGIPRGLLLYRYGVLWKTFFENLGLTVVVSPETDRAIADRGETLSVDETCLASKVFMGHVDALAECCDAVFVPCYASGNPRAGYCTKFQSVTDVAANVFRDRKLRVISCQVQDSSNAKETRRAFMGLAQRLGAPLPRARKAWKAAEKAQKSWEKRLADGQEKALDLLDDLRRLAAKSPDGSEPVPLAILVVSHPYISHDRYLSSAVTDALESMDCVVLFADQTNREKAYKASFDFSDTMPWTVNRELIGSILLLQDRIDGIVLISAFPCGPDSMTDDAIMRCIQGKPILNLMIDAQSGTAGIETRVESFVDILRYQQKGGYVHG